MYGWKITEADLLWEWINGIILRHPSDPEKVVKLAKESKNGEHIDSLETEFKNHTAFSQVLKELKKEFKGKPEEKYLENFKIPEVKRFQEKKWIYEMDRIDGQNLRSKFYLEYYQKELSDLPKNLLNNLNDNQITSLLKERNLRELPKNSSEVDKFYETLQWRELAGAWDKFFDHRYWPTYWWILKPVLGLFQKKWYYHNDEHLWNFMEWKDGSTYMIDFGRSRIPKDKTLN